MQKYIWKGLNASGHKQSGTLYARTPETLKTKLLTQGIALLSFQKSYQRSSLNPLHFFQNLSLLLDAGLPLIESLHITKGCHHMIEAIEKGQTLSSAMRGHFSPLMIHMTKSGEQAGNLAHALTQLHAYLAQKQALQQQLRRAATMPLITLTFSLCIIAMLIMYIIPQLTPFLPPDSFVITLSTFLQSNTNKAGIVIGLIALLGLIRLAKQSKKRWYDAIVVHIPYVGTLVTQCNIVQYIQALSFLLQNNVVLKEALELSSDTCRNTRIKQSMKQMVSQIEQGRSLHQAAMKNKYMPQYILSLIDIGEQSGTLPKTLGKGGKILHTKLQARLTVLIAFVQPLLLILTGLCIAFLMLSIYMPLFSRGFVNT